MTKTGKSNSVTVAVFYREWIDQIYTTVLEGHITKRQFNKLRNNIQMKKGDWMGAVHTTLDEVRWSDAALTFYYEMED